MTATRKLRDARRKAAGVTTIACARKLA